jgi:selenocysteine lyase/cysteine desulfurase
MLCAEKGARLRVAPMDDSGQVLLDEYEKLLGPKTRLVSITHVSNALGTILPVKEMVEAAHRHGARVLVAGAQAVSHMCVDVQAIGCDFYVFSGHKVFAPTGIGVLYGRPEVLDNMPPWQGVGNMIQDVTFEKTLYQPPPQRFEAGTDNIADAVGLGAAIDYLDRVGIANVSRHEHQTPDERFAHAENQLDDFRGLNDSKQPRKHAQHATFRARGNQSRRWRLGIKAAVARAILGAKNTGLPFEAEDGGIDIGLAAEHAGIVDQVARGKVIGAIGNDVEAIEDRQRILAVEVGIEALDAHKGIDGR